MRITIKNKEELANTYEKAEKLMKELADLFWGLHIFAEVSDEPPEESDGCGESE